MAGTEFGSGLSSFLMGDAVDTQHSMLTPGQQTTLDNLGKYSGQSMDTLAGLAGSNPYDRLENTTSAYTKGVYAPMMRQMSLDSNHQRGGSTLFGSASRLFKSKMQQGFSNVLADRVEADRQKQMQGYQMQAGMLGQLLGANQGSLNRQAFDTTSAMTGGILSSATGLFGLGATGKSVFGSSGSTGGGGGGDSSGSSLGSLLGS